MDAHTTFDSGKESLSSLLSLIEEGKTQLPDFQRGWVWDDDHVKSLLASVSLSFPIGAVMMLETGNVDVRFKPRTVEGVSLPAAKSPDQLILDGQQRLTSMYLALKSKVPVLTRDARKKPIKRWYYVDIAKALDPMADREDAIVSLPEDRQIRNFRGEIVQDYSTRELECQHELLPLNVVFDLGEITNWQMAYLQSDPANFSDRLKRWTDIVSRIIQPFQQYQVPLITLRKETPKEAVCQVFEKVNTGGVTLTVFELLTATFATDDYSLRDDWAERKKRLNKYPVLRGVDSDDVLQAITLLMSRERRQQAIAKGIASERLPGITCKRKDILRLTLEDYTTWIEPTISGFEKAARLLHTQHIFADRDLPYRSQLTPLSAILSTLGGKAEHDGVRSRVLQWYWCGVFGELYGGATETRFARDLPDVVEWIETDTGQFPGTITDANFSPQRLLTLRTRNSAAYKGIHSILMRDGGEDFRTGETIGDQTYFDDRIDIHHIFPQK